MSRFIFYAILFYLLYRFIVDLAIPVSKAGRQVRSQMRNMQEQQNMQQQQYHRQQEQAARREEEKKIEKDYIDFEEIK